MAKLSEVGIQKILLLGGIGYALILLAVFVTAYLLQQVPNERLLLILGAVALVSITSVLISFIFLGKTVNLTETADRLQQGLKELHEIRAIAISDEDLKNHYESEASKIRIISPDLYDDIELFYETIVANLRSGKIYEYVIPRRPEVVSKMKELLEKIQYDLGVTAKEKLPIRYSIVDFPIITEYVLYKTPKGKKELEGFMEIHFGPDARDISNLPLDESKKHQINELFNNLFG